MPGPAAGLPAGAPPHAAWPLTRKRIFILPTRHGLVFAVVLCVLLLGATNYNNSLAFVLTFLLASLGLVSMLHTYRNLAGLSVQVLAPEAVFAGSRARFPVVIDNAGSPQRFGVMVRTGRRDDALAVPVTLDAGGEARVELPVPAPRRGWCAPGRICVLSRAPLGLFRAWAWVPCAARGLVYPRPLGEQHLPGPASHHAHSGRRRIRGDDEYAGLRPYRPGDPPRRIHWRASARSVLPPVKQFDSVAGRELMLRFDEVAVTEPEARLAQLSAWVLEAAARGLTYGLELPAARVEPHQGPGHRARCLGLLAVHGLPGDAPAS